MRLVMPLFLLLCISLLTALPSYAYQTNANMTVVHPTPINDYLTNPGIGWQHVPGIGDPLLPETVAYFNRETISWDILNPAEGVYDWSELDEQMDEAAAEGKQVSFRVYTMRGEDFGGHRLPEWVLASGATLLPVTQEPDYSNCVYQEKWGVFVDQLRQRYDGNPLIAFIDISGYANFNEWSWQDEQTEWDDEWFDAYDAGEADRSTMSLLDSQARRRLVDAYIGGSYDDHECRNADGTTQTAAYNYVGFQTTQLVMPYAGIVQSSQYTHLMRPDVGFRYDCLGRESGVDILDDLEEELDEIWRVAPVVFEFCGYLDFGFMAHAEALFKGAHASLVHDNLEDEDRSTPVETLLHNAGYRYVLKEAAFTAQVVQGDVMDINMIWNNVGYAPNYPRMGQDFQLHFYVTAADGSVVAEYALGADTTTWLPADPVIAAPPDYPVNERLQLPGDVPPGLYGAEIAVINLRTGQSINLAIWGRDAAGRYPLGKFEIVPG